MLTKGLWILDSPYIMPGWKPRGYRCLYKSVVTELLTPLRNSINLLSYCTKRLISFPGSTVILVNVWNFVNLKSFQTRNRLKNYFRFKDCVPETLQSNFVYKFKCRSWTASYYGKTYRHMKIRVSEHQGVSPWTGKRVKPLLIGNKRKPFH